MAARRWLVLALAIGACVTPPTINLHPQAGRLAASAAATAFQQGIEAADLGVALETCPYSIPDARRAWRAGWQWAHGR